MKLKISHIFFFLCAFLVFFEGRAQNESNLSELEKKINLSTNSEKINLLISYANELSTVDLSKSIKSAEEALKLSHSSQDKKLIAGSYNQLSYLYFLNDKFLQGNSYGQQAKTLYQEISDKNGTVDALNNLTSVAIASSNPQAQDFNDEAIKLAKEIAYDKGLALAYSNLGELKSKLPTEYVKNHENAINIAEKIGDKKLSIFLYNKLGTFYKSKAQNIDKAIEYYQKELQTKSQIRDNISIVDNLNRLASIYKDGKRDYYTALEYYFQSFVTVQSYPMYQKNETFVSILEGIIDCYKKLKEKHQQTQETDKATAYQKLEQAYISILNQFQSKGNNIENYNNTQQKVIAQNSYSDSQKTRLLEISVEKLRLDQLAKDKQIGILEEAKEKAQLRTEEDGIKILQQEKLITSLKDERIKQKQTIDSLNQFINTENTGIVSENNNWFWIILLSSLLLITLAYLWYVNINKETVIKEMMQSHTNKLKMYGEENYKQVIKIKEQDKQIQELASQTASNTKTYEQPVEKETSPIIIDNTIEPYQDDYTLVNDLPLPVLNEDEKSIIKPFIPKLNQFAFYETGSIKKLITEIDTQGKSNLENWKSQVESAVLLLDENKYKQLITV